jgi:uncharacterized RDD family membrane protein YckC
VDGAACPRCGVDIASYRAELAGAAAPPAISPFATPPPPAPIPAPPSRITRPAGFWIRFVAVVIDTFALVGAQLVLGSTAWIVFGGAASSAAVIDAAVRGFVGVLGLVYPVIFHWLWGQTLGKMAMQIRVIMLDGAPITLGTAVIRQLASWLSALIFGIGYLMAGLRTDKRALHDLLAGTRVVRLT